MSKHGWAEAPEPPTVAASPEQLLWLAVLERAILDTRGADPRLADSARRWLLESPDFVTVCDYAGVEEPGWLREVLRKHRTPPAVRLRPTLLTDWPLAA